MPYADIEGLRTAYEVHGSGAPLLMFSPGGFDATRHKWAELGVYARTRLLEQLSARFTCITFDRRETGESAGRLQRVTWADYAAQGRGLLAHLGIARAHLMGGCMGCGPVLAFAVAYPAVAQRLVLIWPVGGAKYRINGQQRFAQHLAYVQQHGLPAVLALAQGSEQSFADDPRLGPWVANLRNDAVFVAAFVAQDKARYLALVAGMARTLLDRDTAPGAEPEELMQCDHAALLIPGEDASHATSAARYIAECLPHADYWDMPVAQQTEHKLPPRVLQFLESP